MRNISKEVLALTAAGVLAAGGDQEASQATGVPIEANSNVPLYEDYDTRDGKSETNSFLHPGMEAVAICVVRIENTPLMDSSVHVTGQEGDDSASGYAPIYREGEEALGEAGKFYFDKGIVALSRELPACADPSGAPYGDKR